LLPHNQLTYHFLQKEQPLNLSFHFLFASLVPPFISPNITLFFKRKKKPIKNLLKNSYMILA